MKRFDVFNSGYMQVAPKVAPMLHFIDNLETDEVEKRAKFKTNSDSDEVQPMITPLFNDGR